MVTYTNRGCRQIEIEFQEFGIDDFLDNPASYLVATNNIGNTKGMLERGVNLYRETLSLSEMMLANRQKSTLFPQSNKMIRYLNAVSKLWQLKIKLFEHSMKVVDFFVEWNSGDAKGILRKEFGVEESDAIWEKLLGEVEKYDTIMDEITKLSEELNEIQNGKE